MQQTSLNLAWLLPAAYLLGSIPFGVIFARLFGSADVRKSGSGNIGATNVARVAGPLAGILTLVFDTGKGAAAVLLAARIAHESAAWMMLAGLAALVGHCFPVWLKFKGGKGVAAALGVFLALCPAAALAALLLFMIVVAMWRYVSLGSIAAAAAIPLLMYFLWAPRHAPPLIITFGSLAAAVLVVYKHDGNIQRLIQGEEPKYSFRKKKDVA
ncbi:MAG TPA: glycerol-3-phosphate 1-O-acyltransferase PlsY [Candidatus Acidoferrum sp.]|jgi:glycerol-3-phosphate acyltransferase PlsY|nr:glycerol-3-phosphate 1-O-acyltransferase PlsY [Candidatus Acidoferrum sp.]